MANPELKDNELNARKTRGTGWVWGLMAVLVVVLLVWWFVDGPVDEGPPVLETRVEEREVESPATGAEEPGATQPIGTAAAVVTAAQILENPDAWSGVTFVGDVEVAEVATERGLWVRDPAAEDGEDAELLVVLDTAGRAPDVEAGDMLRIGGAVVRDAVYADSLAGLDDATRRLAADQAVILTADPADLAVVGAGG
jgi:hypothetical protein